MWRRSTDIKKDLATAIVFTGDSRKYGRAMYRVIVEWPISCEHNLSNVTQNRRAWLGHAACALVISVPENVVRMAWGKITSEQRLLADAEAEKNIRIWESWQN